MFIKKVPSKTFFWGEYLALVGGPAFIGLTQPCFQVNTEKKLHPHCIAARFWQSMTGYACDWGLEDPYHGQGGLGASTAEFLLAYQKIYGAVKSLEHLRHSYWQYAEGTKPSGYDLLAQTSQGCTLIESAPLKLHSFSWPFKELGFILVHTGKKLPTHEHLRTLTQDILWRPLAKAVERAIAGFEAVDADHLIAATQGAFSGLVTLNLQAKHTLDWLSFYMPKLPILAAKGCGAMGSDVIFILAKNENVEMIKEKLIEWGQTILATHADLYFEDAKK